MPDGIPFHHPDGIWRWGDWEGGTYTAQRRNLADCIERTQALRALTAGLDSVIYALQLHGGIIKLGYTVDLVRRRGDFTGSTILGFKGGTIEEEREIHKSLKPHRAYGHEYYHPVPEVLAVVNEMREPFNLPPLEAA